MRSDFFGGNVLDVGLASVQFFNLFVVGIEARNDLPHFREAQGQRQADVTAADDSNLQVFSSEKFRLPIRTHSDSSLCAAPVVMIDERKTSN